MVDALKTHRNKVNELVNPGGKKRRVFPIVNHLCSCEPVILQSLSRKRSIPLFFPFSSTWKNIVLLNIFISSSSLFPVGFLVWLYSTFSWHSMPLLVLTYTHGHITAALVPLLFYHVTVTPLHILLYLYDMYVLIQSFYSCLSGKIWFNCEDSPNNKNLINNSLILRFTAALIKITTF